MSTPNFRNFTRLTLLSSFLFISLKNNSTQAQTSLKPAPLQKGNSRTLNGRITDQATGETLIGVSITAKGIKTGTTTNNYGYFSLTVPTDTATFRISYIGYQTIDTPINLALKSTVAFRLKPLQNELNTVVIKGAANSVPIQNTSQMGKINLPISQIQALPRFFGEPDLFKALQTLPGVQQGSEGTSAMLVRGGSPDQNLILLDGAPLYNPSHLLGIFSAFNTYAIKNVDLYKGAFPARYGGRLSSVVDISMNDGNMNKVHGQFTLGLLASQLTLEGPLKKDKTSFIISGRRTYHDLFISPILKSSQPDIEKFQLYFYDLNAKIHHKFSDKDHLYLSFYNGQDKLRTKVKQGSSDGATTLGDFGLGWRNLTGAARWNHVFSNKLFANTTLTTSQYKFNTTMTSSIFGSKVNVNSDDILSINSGITDYTAKIDFDYQPLPAHSIKMGVSSTLHAFTPGTSLSKQSFNNETLKDENLGGKIKATELDLYAEDDWTITDKLKANIGLHASGFNVQGKFYTSLQPRISARYLLPGDWALKASYAKMTQYMHLLASNSISLPTDLWVPATNKVLPQQSNQFSLGVSRNIFNDQFEFSAESYYKTMNNIIEYKDGADYVVTSEHNDWENKITTGKGKAMDWNYSFRKKQAA